MQKTMDEYVRAGKLSDLQIVSTAGLTKEDVAEAEKLSDVTVETGKTTILRECQ